MDLKIRIIFYQYFLFSQSFHPHFYFLNYKAHYHHLIKGFQFLIGVLKHLIGSLHFAPTSLCFHCSILLS